MHRTTLFLWSVFALAVGLGAIADLAVAQEAPKWFVLRQETTSDCRTVLLIKIGGGYASGTSLKAGGPYETEAEALAQQKALEERGVCAKS